MSIEPFGTVGVTVFALQIFSEATNAAIQNLKAHPNEFNIELNIRVPVYGIEEKPSG